MHKTDAVCNISSKVNTWVSAIRYILLAAHQRVILTEERGKFGQTGQVCEHGFIWVFCSYLSVLCRVITNAVLRLVLNALAYSRRKKLMYVFFLTKNKLFTVCDAFRDFV